MAKKEWYRDPKTLSLLGAILVLVVANATVYFLYYQPRAERGDVHFAEAPQNEVVVPAFDVVLSLVQSGGDPSVEDGVLFSVDPGEQAVRTAPVSSGLSASLSASHVKWAFAPKQRSVLFTRSPAMEVSDELFVYKESPHLTDLFAILSSEGYRYGEVVPLYWEGADGDLWHVNRMLFFTNARQELSNNTVYIEYAHLIGDDIIGGPEVEKLRVSSLNTSVVAAVRERYEPADGLLFSASNSSYIGQRADIYRYYLRRDAG